MRFLICMAAIAAGAALGLIVLGRAMRTGWYGCTAVLRNPDTGWVSGLQGLSEEMIAEQLRQGAGLMFFCQTIAGQIYVGPIVNSAVIALSIILPAAIALVVAVKATRRLRSTY
ncbi:MULTISPECIES: hypothetical protein [unclassified Yoonia]|uniref:hypothetical protein n=1 Tax=unclassified Yoonia TaxID=2629118 RepID=UPI002AFE6318|nr:MULTISPECIES: hypothetical protein [unclassified Yoonia]